MRITKDELYSEYTECTRETVPQNIINELISEHAAAGGGWYKNEVAVGDFAFDGAHLFAKKGTGLAVAEIEDMPKKPRERDFFDNMTPAQQEQHLREMEDAIEDRDE